MKKEYLIRTNSDEDIKIVRAEFKRLNIKFNEKCEKTLRKHMLTDNELNSFDLTKVFVFRNIIIDNVSKNVSMLISQNPIKWDRCNDYDK
jgi:hypothetical protein